MNTSGLIGPASHFENLDFSAGFAVNQDERFARLPRGVPL